MLKLRMHSPPFVPWILSFQFPTCFRVFLLSLLFLSVFLQSWRRHVNVTPSSIDSFWANKSVLLSRAAPLLKFLPKVPTILIMRRGGWEEAGGRTLLCWSDIFIGQLSTQSQLPTLLLLHLQTLSFYTEWCSPQSSNRNLYVCLSEFI